MGTTARAMAGCIDSKIRKQGEERKPGSVSGLHKEGGKDLDSRERGKRDL